MKRRALAVSLSLAALVTTPLLWAADRFQSGQWETTVTEKGASRSNTHCLTPAQVKSANGSPDEVRAALEKGAADLHCTVKGLKLEGDTLSYTYACAGRSTEYATSYHGDRYESVVTTTDPAGSRVTQIKGRRLGVCP